MNDLDRKADYEKSANEYWRWRDVAISLGIAADILEGKYKAVLQAIQKKERGKMPKEFDVLAPMIYLKAKCLELYIKALCIKNGVKPVTKDGKLTKRKRYSKRVQQILYS